MQSSVMIDRNGAGIIVAYIRSMMWLPAILTSMKCCELAPERVEELVEASRRRPGRRSSARSAGSVRGSKPSLSVISMTFGRLK